MPGLLATYWVPSLDPIGPGSIYPVVLVTALCLLSARFIPRRLRVVTTFAALIVLTAGLFTPGSLFCGIFFRTFPGLDDHAGHIIILVFGWAFGIRLLRHPSRTAGFLARYAAFTFGSFAVYKAIAQLKIVWTCHLYETGVIDSPVQPPILNVILLLLPVFWIGNTKLVRRIRREHLGLYRMAHGLCPRCAYDCHGRTDATSCPECGATLTTQPYARPL